MLETSEIKSQKNIVYIYALLDPTNNKICYIGKSVDPITRYKTHIDVKEDINPTTNWIIKLRELHMLPMMKIIEQTDNDHWQEREKYWIAFFGLKNLKNLIQGGYINIYNPVPFKKVEKDEDSLEEFHKNNSKNRNSKIEILYKKLKEIEEKTIDDKTEEQIEKLEYEYSILIWNLNLMYKINYENKINEKIKIIKKQMNDW